MSMERWFSTIGRRGRRLRTAAGIVGASAMLVAASGCGDDEDSPAAAGGGGSLERITLSVPLYNQITFAPFMAAVEQGFFAEEGLEVELQQAGGSQAIPAVISGKLQYSASASSGIPAIAQGAKLRVVMTLMGATPYEIWTSDPAVQSLADLDGKSLGTAGPGDTYEQAARLLFDQEGVDPDAVTYTPLGTGGPRLAAIQGGAVKAAVLDPNEVQSLQSGPTADKFRKLGDTRDVAMPASGVITSTAEIEEHPERVEKVLRALWKGRNFVEEDREGAFAAVQKYAPESSPESLAGDYDSVVPLFTPDGTLPEDTLQTVTELQLKLQKVKDPGLPLGDYYDYSIIEQVVGQAG